MALFIPWRSCWPWISCCRKTRPRVATHQKLKNSLTSNWLSTDLFRNNFHWPCIKQLIIKNNPLLHMYICFGFIADNQYFCLTMAFCAQGNKKSLTFHWLWQFIKDVPWPFPDHGNPNQPVICLTTIILLLIITFQTTIAALHQDTIVISWEGLYIPLCPPKSNIWEFFSFYCHTKFIYHQYETVNVTIASLSP